MNVCFVTSEAFPFAKTGGLGDVLYALPRALAGSGCSVKVVMPLYGSISTIDHNLVFSQDLYELRANLGHFEVTFNVWYLHREGVDFYFVDCPHYFHRNAIYTHDADEAERFILLQHAAFLIMQRYGWEPDIVQGNDWPTGLMPAMLRQTYGWDSLFAHTGSVLGIHNVAYQGSFSSGEIFKAGLEHNQFYAGGPLELHGAFSFLKSGIALADAIITVSPTYAREIQTPDFGVGLDGALRSRASDLVGILNGIDTDIWDPATDQQIAANYDINSLDQKEANKVALLHECGLPYHRDVPVLGVVSRMAAQKGLSLFQPILGPLLESRNVQLVVLGSGAKEDEDFFRQAAAIYPDRVHARIGFDEGLAHRIEAGADAFVMPSLYEPCGLNQMYSLRYGTVPIVRRTGGLADTVVDQDESGGFGNGFSFYDFTPGALLSSLNRAISCFELPEVWREIQQRGMGIDFSWSASASHYMDVYRAVRSRRG